MLDLATEAYENVPVPRRVKISSKRQITIPVDVYKRHGFAEYALLTETEEGLVIQPLSVEGGDEEITISLLRYLISKGYEGEALLEKYAEIKPSFSSFYRAIQRSEDDIAAGRTVDFDEMQVRMKEKYGL